MDRTFLFKLKKKNYETYGFKFQIIGRKCLIKNVNSKSVSFTSGLRKGDLIISINGKNVRNLSEREISHIIRWHPNNLDLRIVRRYSQVDVPQLNTLQTIGENTDEDKDMSKALEGENTDEDIILKVLKDIIEILMKTDNIKNNVDISRKKTTRRVNDKDDFSLRIDKIFEYTDEVLELLKPEEVKKTTRRVNDKDDFSLRIDKIFEYTDEVLELLKPEEVKDINEPGPSGAVRICDSDGIIRYVNPDNFSSSESD